MGSRTIDLLKVRQSKVQELSFSSPGIFLYKGEGKSSLKEVSSLAFLRIIIFCLFFWKKSVQSLGCHEIVFLSCLVGPKVKLPKIQLPVSHLALASYLKGSSNRKVIGSYGLSAFLNLAIL